MGGGVMDEVGAMMGKAVKMKGRSDEDKEEK